MAIKSIVTNLARLRLVSEPVIDFKEISLIVDNLLDTAIFESKRGAGCVGLAMNQIGILERVIVVFVGGKWVVMINPVITDKYAGKTTGKEMCLSRPGVKTFKK